MSKPTKSLFVFLVLALAFTCQAQQSGRTASGPLGNLTEHFVGTSPIQAFGVSPSRDWAFYLRDGNLSRLNLKSGIETIVLPKGSLYTYSNATINDSGLIAVGGSYNPTGGTAESQIFFIDLSGAITTALTNQQTVLEGSTVSSANIPMFTPDGDSVVVQAILGNNLVVTLKYANGSWTVPYKVAASAPTPKFNIGVYSVQNNLAYGYMQYSGNNFSLASMNLNSGNTTTLLGTQPVVDGVAYDLGATGGLQYNQVASSNLGMLALSRRDSLATGTDPVTGMGIVDLLFSSIATGQTTVLAKAVTSQATVNASNDGYYVYSARPASNIYSSAVYRGTLSGRVLQVAEIVGPDKAAFPGDQSTNAVLPFTGAGGQVAFVYDYTINGTEYNSVVLLDPPPTRNVSHLPVR